MQPDQAEQRWGDEPRFGSPPFAVYLAPGDYIDSDHPEIRNRSRAIATRVDRPERAARAIFDYVREVPYEGDDFEDLDTYRASSVLAVGHGYCVSKASLFVALARAAGLPARIAFADVTNHLASPRLLEAMQTNVFAWHGFAEVHLGGRWVKASPTFDTPACRRAGVEPLEFNGVNDALLQAFDGGQTMEYLSYHGSFHDVPARFLAEEMVRLYPFTRDRGITRYKAAALDPGDS